MLVCFYVIRPDGRRAAKDMIFLLERIFSKSDWTAVGIILFFVVLGTLVLIFLSKAASDDNENVQLCSPDSDKRD